VEPNFNHVVEEFAQAAMPGVPKHVRLRNAVLAAIRKGHLKPGDQLPPEQEVCKAVGLSLGTVQRALGSLANDRTLVREQGRGTFISKPELPHDELWQFRFVRRYGEAPLPVSVAVLDRHVVRERQPWLDVLGHDERGYCALERLIVVNSDFRCLSRFYVRVSRFPSIMKVPSSKIAGNLKRFLAEEFETPTNTIEQFATPCVLDKKIAALLEVEAGSAGMLINTIGRTVSQEAITVQSMWVPAGDYYLEFNPDRPPNRFPSFSAK
jgi:DNA-binding GntR family transcriptional regulator